MSNAYRTLLYVWCKGFKNGSTLITRRYACRGDACIYVQSLIRALGLAIRTLSPSIRPPLCDKAFVFLCLEERELYALPYLFTAGFFAEFVLRSEKIVVEDPRLRLAMSRSGHPDLVTKRPPQVLMVAQ